MSTLHTFDLVVDGVAFDDIDRLFDVGLDDATPAEIDGLLVVTVDREADTFARALLSAVEQVAEAAGTVLRVLGSDDLVTQSEIARRTSRTRESVRLLTDGRRGPGGYPSAIGRTDGQPSMLWSWQEVRNWFTDALGQEPDRPGASISPDDVALIAAVNATLDSHRTHRAIRRHLDERTRDDLAAWQRRSTQLLDV